ncbi:aromatic ring-hydroxylating dioxygenase subunit alpha [Croceicoccus mobilis]|uniref:(2Fe-2S)-binding protein n=1 Tax=Croceicoccus mobilis TaxID=1703339 RepID=A0A916Z5D4_9SPHN|nr:aromatic ring-hydroxylating dioxygenase subunit alpha [Croceicoccus mobilis]GGD77172.1 (2Fe-2S)-binding protein [Croceicoccus mobilis]
MPFVYNAWYVIALPDEVIDRPLARTVLGMPLVSFRQTDGAAAVLLDLCPHRFAALSDGSVAGGRLQCPYHGLQFDGGGRCVHNPHGNGARPSTLDVRSFPVVERDDLIWIWAGDAGDADPADIPDFRCRVDPDLGHVGGYFHLGCNDRLLLDNLMDLGHVQYVHSSKMQSDGFARHRRDVVRERRDIHAFITYPSAAPNALTRRMLPDAPELVDGWSDVRWFPVSATLNYVAYAPAGSAKESSRGASGTHILTPESEGATHYFFGSSRNFAIDDPAIDQVLREWQIQALTREDKRVVEQVEARSAYARAHEFTPAMLSCDEAAVRVSREIDRLERVERERASTSHVAPISTTADRSTGLRG